jgi:alcohol oxidase
MLTSIPSSRADLVILRWAYKKVREIGRRMSSFRGELAPAHPAFKGDSLLACGPKEGPVAMDAPDLVYTQEDDEIIDKFHREKSKCLLYR